MLLRILLTSAILLELKSVVWSQLMNCNLNFVYRTMDGTCNNLQNPLWGSAGCKYRRDLPPQYENDDGNTMRGSGRNSDLPSPRVLSSALSKLMPAPRVQEISQIAVAWGQFLTHDMTRAVSSPDFNCNCRNGQLQSPSFDSNCQPIDVSDDEFFQSFNVECLPFVRDQRDPTSNRQREQTNSATSFVDGSQIYGSSFRQTNILRSRCFGRLRIGPETENIDSGVCPMACPLTFPPSIPSGRWGSSFLAGDNRVEEQPPLTTLHVLFVRVHNDIAQRLFFKHPFWDDETLFQETRRIVIALLQKITYEEYLPAILGESAFKLSLKHLEYDETVNPSLSSAFSTAAHRFGHSLIPENYTLLSGEFIELAKSFNQRSITLNDDSSPSNFLRSLGDIDAEPLDHVVTDALRNKLFANPPFTHGSDLFARNINRGRDRGVPPYNDFREFCGLPKFNSFEELESVMPREVVQVFIDNYSDVNDIDLYPAGLAERRKDSHTVLGPTFNCIITRQFRRLRMGDRFFYTHKDQPKPFNSNQLLALDRTSLASLICAYTAGEDRLPSNLFTITDRRSTRSCSEFFNELPSFIQAFW